MGDFRKLEVWRLAHKVVCEVYGETANFPKTEAYGGSATELEYHLLLAHDVGFLSAAPYESLSAQAHRIQGMLAGLNRTLKKPRLSPQPTAHGP